jgi:hypothetical protein
MSQSKKLQASLNLLSLLVAISMASPASAGPRRSKCKSKNYILRRQEAYQVQGVPTSRLIIGKREIDIYPNGMAFEGDNRVR